MESVVDSAMYGVGIGIALFVVGVVVFVVAAVGKGLRTPIEKPEPPTTTSSRR
jgi:hypothetical protein